MPRLAKIAEVTTILALIAGTAWLGQLVRHNYVTHAESSGSAGPVTAPVDIPARTLGGVDAVLQVSGREAPLMLFVLSTTCPFCEQNMSEWRSLAARIDELGPASAGDLCAVGQRGPRDAGLPRNARARPAGAAGRSGGAAAPRVVRVPEHPGHRSGDPRHCRLERCIEHRRSGRRAHMGSLCDGPPPPPPGASSAMLTTDAALDRP